MTPYSNLSGKSGATHYEVGAGFVRVTFRGGSTYEYNDASCGKATVEELARLARAGRGLCTFISRNKPGFVRR